MLAFKTLAFSLLAASVSADHHLKNASLLDIIESEPEFSIMSSAIELLGSTFQGALETTGPFTLFLPTDDAVLALPNSTRTLLFSGEGIPLLTNILAYHAVVELVLAADLVDGGMYPTALGEGANLTVTLDPPMVNFEANITETDIIATNGVIHAIDAVLSLPVADMTRA